MGEVIRHAEDHAPRIRRPARPEEPQPRRALPLLIVGGTQDDIVPQAMLTTMAADLKDCGQNVEFKLFPGGHSPYGGDEQALIQDWFLRHGISLQL